MYKNWEKTRRREVNYPCCLNSHGRHLNHLVSFCYSSFSRHSFFNATKCSNMQILLVCIPYEKFVVVVKGCMSCSTIGKLVLYWMVAFFNLPPTRIIPYLSTNGFNDNNTLNCCQFHYNILIFKINTFHDMLDN